MNIRTYGNFADFADFGDLFTGYSSTTTERTSSNKDPFPQPDYIGVTETEDKDGYNIFFNIAGFKPDSFDVEIKGKTITFSSSKLLPMESIAPLFTNDKTGKYTLTLTTNAPVTTEGFYVVYDQGILRLVVYKQKDSTSGKIKIGPNIK